MWTVVLVGGGCAVGRGRPMGEAPRVRALVFSRLGVGGAARHDAWVQFRKCCRSTFFYLPSGLLLLVAVCCARRVTCEVCRVTCVLVISQTG